MARIQIYLTDELKERMDAQEGVNWSETASKAFVAKLGELAREREEKDMQDVIDRLRASKQESEAEEHRQGRLLGKRWAKEDADYRELERLGEVSKTLWLGQPKAPYTRAQWLTVEVLGQQDPVESDLDDFLEGIFGEGEISDDMLQGFIDGAEEVYAQVWNKV